MSTLKLHYLTQKYSAKRRIFQALLNYKKLSQKYFLLLFWTRKSNVCFYLHFVDICVNQHVESVKFTAGGWASVFYAQNRCSRKFNETVLCPKSMLRLAYSLYETHPMCLSKSLALLWLILRFRSSFKNYQPIVKIKTNWSRVPPARFFSLYGAAPSDVEYR